MSGFADFRPDPLHVGIADVAAILAQMRRDAVGAGLDGEVRRAHGIGQRAAAGVADGRDMVDVDAEAEETGGEFGLCGHAGDAPNSWNAEG